MLIGTNAWCRGTSLSCVAEGARKRARTTTSGPVEFACPLSQNLRHAPGTADPRLLPTAPCLVFTSQGTPRLLSDLNPSVRLRMHLYYYEYVIADVCHASL
eukprot:7113042-Prymnesium_polylepis.1